jgi:hypothetical protein
MTDKTHAADHGHAGLTGVRTFLPEHAHGVPLVAVHGRSRRSGEQFRAFLPSAISVERV